MFPKLFALFAVTFLVQSASGIPFKLFDFDEDDTLFDDKECKDLRDDCDKMPAKGEKLMEYCKQWENDPAVKECPKTCGRCKAPSPTKECKDDRPDCSWITDNNRGDENLDKYCRAHQKDEAVRQCKKTCGLCKPPSPTKECKDERLDCSWITDNNPGAENLDKYCRAHERDEAVKQCKKTCGLCKKPPSPPKPPTQRPVQPTNPPKPQPTEPPKPKPKQTFPQGGQMTGFQRECLVAHNRLRARHFATPPLRWSAELAADAQAYANKLAAENSFAHDPNLKEIGQGENLAWFSPANRMCNGPSDVNCAHCGEFVQDWYNEIDDYSFSKGTGKEPWSVILHFTQVVWRATAEVGMATATAHNRVVAVARYRIPGNQYNMFKENVLPLNP